MIQSQIIKKPLITEKNSILAETGIYSFEVDRRASKTEIKSAIEKFFQVKVQSVNTLQCRGKARRNRFGISKPKYWKKAMVRLMPGEKISIFEGA
ncbi:MAG: 50S ribosomal protein L23 [Bdellovibrionaceae bacterium]|nr:50S ribosomal protein L23 [Pseudobdellovibrionaceae bacterium]|tara:strand:+ start:4477 stop:4761 length:285 start_codon:yes stop_codon:yes gene_type:complete